MGGECYFEIVAPYVQHLKILGLGDLSSLIHADLTYHSSDYHRLDNVIDKIIVKDHLTRVACANELIIPSLHDFHVDVAKRRHFITIVGVQMIDDKFFVEQIHLPWHRQTLCLENLTILPIVNLKTLKVILQWSPFIEDETIELTELMKCLLEHANYLEKLIIVAENSGCSKVIQSLLALPRVSNTIVVSLKSVAGVEY
ncbi:hypothetical protein H5410_006033 [Solanum commersonii]|uniref:FBD domain-containing protein n=1 Tax=Solanum commersonii TaxID=4109 RepID=A0A9J6AA24_SOLCO|nr:hypothetical protein H5410_006033 [Solanum commersonii]